MLLRAVATCVCSLALGSSIATFLTVKALLQTTLPFLALALEKLILPYQALVNDLVRISALAYSITTSGSEFVGRHPGQPANVFDLRLGWERSVFLQDLVRRVLELFRFHCAGTDAIC